MTPVVLAHEVDWDGWRSAARRLVQSGTHPDDVAWSVGAPADLFAEGEVAEVASAGPGSFTVPRALVDLAQTVIQNREAERFALLYRLIWRAHDGEKHLLEMVTDPEVHRAGKLAQSVRRDTHKMRAFVRFREVHEAEAVRYVSWFEPDHYIVEANAAFFVRRFATMTWSILTPYRSVHWDGAAVAFGPGALKADVPDDDRLDVYWRAYYSSIFNPARLKTGAMKSEMPRKYWRNLPEAAAIPELIRTAGNRTEAMIEQPSFSPAKPARPAASAPQADAPASMLQQAASDVHACRRCALWQPATQPVFGEGPADARIMMVGEQPGDQEDLAGRPFVGPAGQLLDRAMAEAGLDRRQVYLTNAVKHFKFVPRGKRRIHEKPGTSEIVACHFWLELERAEVAPAVTVMLGATAARAVLGRAVAVTRERGRPIPLSNGAGGLEAGGANTLGFITVHPSYLLRLPDEEAKAREWTAFVSDLRAVAALAG